MNTNKLNMKNDEIISAMREALNEAIKNYPLDWSRARHPKADDLLGSAWIILCDEITEEEENPIGKSARKALFREAWRTLGVNKTTPNGRSIGGTVEDEDDFLASKGKAVHGSEYQRNGEINRPTEASAIYQEEVKTACLDKLDETITAYKLSGYTNEEVASILKKGYATIARRWSAIQKRLSQKEEQQ